MTLVVVKRKKIYYTSSKPSKFSLLLCLSASKFYKHFKENFKIYLVQKAIDFDFQMNLQKKKEIKRKAPSPLSGQFGPTSSQPHAPLSDQGAAVARCLPLLESQTAGAHLSARSPLANEWTPFVRAIPFLRLLLPIHPPFAIM